MGYTAGRGAELCCGGEEKEALKGRKKYQSKGCFLAFILSIFTFLLFIFFKSERRLRWQFGVGAAEVRGSRLPHAGR